MEELRKLRDWLHATRRKLATLAVAVVACAMLAHVVFGANGIMIYRQKRAEYQKLEKQIQELQKENNALTDRTKALKSDPATIEKEAREQLRYAKPGEVVYVMPEQQTAQNPPATAKSGKPATGN